MRMRYRHRYRGGSGAHLGSWTTISKAFWVTITRRILPENQAACNTADTAKTDKSSAAERTLPLSTDVVGLVSHGCRDVRVRARAGKEDTEVSDTGVLVETHQGETDEDKDHVEDDDRSTGMVLVANPAGEEHDDTGKNIWRSDQALSRANAVAHTLTEDDGKEVGESVGDGGSVEEDHGETPHLDIRASSQELAKVEGLNERVTTIGLDAVDDELDLALVQEPPGLVLAIREINEGPVTDDTNKAGELQRVSHPNNTGCCFC